jgi:hypothetical protein
MKKEMKKLVKVLESFQNRLSAFDEGVVGTWSIEGLRGELDELIAQTNDEIGEFEDEE